MEESLRKEVEENFLDFLSYIKAILEEELSEVDISSIEDYLKIVVEQPELYEDWLEKVESAPLPDLEKIEKLEYKDGTHLKITYSLKTEEATHYRRIKVKSNGEVKVKDFVEMYRYIDGKKVQIRFFFDVYGNLIFELKKVE